MIDVSDRQFPENALADFLQRLREEEAGEAARERERVAPDAKFSFLRRYALD